MFKYSSGEQTCFHHSIQMKQPVVLIGRRGCGKTHFATLLSRATGKPLLDDVHSLHLNLNSKSEDRPHLISQNLQSIPPQNRQNSNIFIYPKKSIRNYPLIHSKI